MATKSIRVLAWSERTEPTSVYPNGINGALADHLNSSRGIVARTAQLDDLNQGVSEEALGETDVLIWFGHVRHEEVNDSTVSRIVAAVKERGMGYLALHSSHWAKPNMALMGTACGWRDYVFDGKPGRIFVALPGHPIARGVKSFVIPEEEWYGEPYEAPIAEAVVLAGVYNDGAELVRDGLVWTVGKGRVFYFRPGHETYPIYFMAEVQRIMVNGVRWLAQRTSRHRTARR